mgnify:CR=1 FL=1
MITTAIFDLDDTLYDELDYCRSGFSAVSSIIGAMPSAPASERVREVLWDVFTGGNRTRTFNEALDRLGIACDDRLIRGLITAYRNHSPELTLPHDSREVLEQLRGQYGLALLTDGFLPAQQLKVRALGIEDYFECIVYTEELGREFWKPSPVGFEKILEQMQAKAENAVYVADNPAKDFIAPNKFGCGTIRLVRPNRIHTEAVERHEGAAQHVIRRITDLPPLLARL